MNSKKDNTIFLKDYRAPLYLIPTTKLKFELKGLSTNVYSEIKVIRQGNHNEPLVLNGENIELVALSMNGLEIKKEDYFVTEDSLTITTCPDEFTLSIHTKVDPETNTELSGLYQSGGNFCTQCEAEGFRRITYFLDRPDVLSVFTVELIADKSEAPVLLSNGNFIETSEEEAGKHRSVWHDPHPKPSYLFALVAGKLEHITDTFTTMSGREVELNIYTQSHNIDKCDHAMRSLKESMKWDEQTYGREYDLSIYNIVAVDDFNMGAMENKGLNVFNSKYVLADQHLATDTDFEGIQSVIGHEYFHNWSGNRVTCRDWFQLSLKEGFTVFRDQEFSADMGSRAVKRIRDVQMLRTYQFKEDAGPMAHPIRPDSYEEINNFYTVTIYEKGAEVIRMLHSLVGKDGFRKSTDLYFDRFDGQAVTTEDFVKCVEEANSIDLCQFRHWYTQAGTPQVSVSKEFNEGVLKLTLSQQCPPTPNQPQKPMFVIPVKLALIGEDGEEIVNETINLCESTLTKTYSNLDSEPNLSILRDFSAPIKLHISRTIDELLKLVELDSNGFTRWEAMQEVGLRVILPSSKSGSIDEDAYNNLLIAFKSLIENPPSDRAIFAEMLTLPNQAYILGLLESPDPQQLVKVKQNLVHRLARDLESSFHAIYANNNQRAEFSLSGEAMAERSLKNVALSYLVASEQAAYHALASHQYHQSNNMTDRLAAFSALLHSGYPERDELVKDFYETWQNEPLVIDKWLALQAMNPRDDVLAVVSELVDHESFEITNPNKVRSLIGAFVSNLNGFHSKDGSGYRFLADQVIKLDKLNPQIAARLSSGLSNWRHFCEPYQSLMRAELSRISDTNNLSKDVSEIVSKALQF